MRRIVLDSNAVDPLVDLPGALQHLQQAVLFGAVEVLYTHITADENLNTPDAERRGQLLSTLVTNARWVPTGSAAWSSSKWDEARWFDGRAVEDIHRGNLRHTNDALIATTAAAEDAVLVTRDETLTNRAQQQGLRVMTMLELLAELGFEGPTETDA